MQWPVSFLDVRVKINERDVGQQYNVDLAMFA